MSWNSFNKPTLCESCGNTDCSSYNTRNIHWQGSNICGSYIKAIIKSFEDGYRFVQHFDTNNTQNYSLLNENKEICISLSIRNTFHGVEWKIQNSDENSVHININLHDFPDLHNLTDNDLLYFIREIPFKYREYTFDSLISFVFLNKDTTFYFMLCLMVNSLQYEYLLTVAIKGANLRYVYYILSCRSFVAYGSITKQTIENIENLLIKQENVKLAYFFARDFYEDFDIPTLEKIILKKMDPCYIRDFAVHVEGADKQKLADAIIKYNDPYFIRTFARDVSGIDVQQLEDAIIKSKDAFEMFQFAMEVDNANTKRLKEAILKTQDNSVISLLNTVED